MCDSVREILTIQAGHFANYVGTHWWNLQEASFVYDARSPTDLNHDFFFQSGLTQKGEETFTPRLVLVDSQGSLGTLSCHGTLYDDSASDRIQAEGVAWSAAATTTIYQLQCHKNEYLKDLEQEEKRIAAATTNYMQSNDRPITSGISAPSGPTTPVTDKTYDLRGSVDYWSDFLRPHFHPDTVCLLPGIWHSEVSGCVDAVVLRHRHAAASIATASTTSGATGATVAPTITSGCNDTNKDHSLPVQHNTTQSATSGELGVEQLWSYCAGTEAAVQITAYDSITDTIRRLAERANSIQGFQVLCHGYDGMGAVASVICEHLYDEYSSKNRMCLPVTPPTVAAYGTRALRPLLTNTFMTYSSLSQNCDLMLPLNLRQHVWRPHAELATLPLYNYQASNVYESSSLLGIFLECITTVFRTKDDPLSLAEFTYRLNRTGHKFLCGEVQLPALARLGGGGMPVSGTKVALPPYAGHVITRRGHKCPVPDDYGTSVVRQASDPLYTTAPFPWQLFTDLPTLPGVTNISSVSCEASVQQSDAGIELQQQLLQDMLQLMQRPAAMAELTTYGVSWDDVKNNVEDWQQELEQEH